MEAPSCVSTFFIHPLRSRCVYDRSKPPIEVSEDLDNLVEMEEKVSDMGNNFPETLTRLEAELTDTNRDLRDLTADQQFAILQTHAVHMVQPELLLDRLRKSKETGVPLQVKYGIDPTSTELHLGHVVPIILARLLQQMGHEIYLLFGTFTARVGDPTGRVSTRPVLTDADIARNVASYKDQVHGFIDLSKVTVVYNDAFYRDMSIAALFDLWSKHTVAGLLQREDFRNRIEGLTITEMLYPTLMAIDSVVMKPDLELGGNDQLLNFQVTVDFMRREGLTPESAITTNLLQGVVGDGAKMSKSRGNFISLRSTAADAFGKLMSMPDSLMQHFFDLLTDIRPEDWAMLEQGMTSGGIHPMEVKKLLARIVVTFLHSKDAAHQAQAEFEHVFSQRELPDDMPTFDVSGHADVQSFLDLLLFTKFVPSKTQARTLVAQQAVRWRAGDAAEFTVVDDPQASLPQGQWVLKVGKRRFANIVR